MSSPYWPFLKWKSVLTIHWTCCPWGQRSRWNMYFGTFLCLSYFYCDRDFVNRSTKLSSVSTFSIYTFPCWMIYLIKWYLLDMCLDRWWDRDFYAYTISPLLSQWSFIEFSINGTTSSLVTNLLIHITSFVTYHKTLYLNSIVKSVTMFSLKLFKLTTLSFRQNTNPD